ncbi:MAG: alpha-amylase family glycosyl hydrolase [Christensenellales bacterium]|jgi:1,4-alpha-glucan branching enzyme
MDYKIIEIDPWLKPFANDINLRMQRYESRRAQLLQGCSSLNDFANGHLFYGFHPCNDGWYYREWAPAADALYLTGDFNSWNPSSHPLQRLDHGNWEIFLPGKAALPHASLVKVVVEKDGQSQDRIPLYATRAVQEQHGHDFSAQIWAPKQPFVWTDANFHLPSTTPLFIYEAHVGMAQEECKVGTYQEFTRNILPRIKKAGYTAIQLMAIQEHPYYGSFGYQVSNFFAISSRFGTPDDLKELINTAHSMGLAVLLDLVHSHAVKNTREGIAGFDGTDTQFFHAGSRGFHPVWDSRLFDYSKDGVLQFLLSNIKFFMQEYHFDGFRFDGITSMLYHSHSIGVDFTEYKQYFTMDTDLDAVNYLQLANELMKEINPRSIAIAEDMSGMPGLCLPISSGGIGFDYRLGMGIPDFWIKTLKKHDDNQWDIWQMWHELTTRRPQEKSIGYSESHDQALVGDKTIMFWLADQEMYWHMGTDDDNIVIDRAIALHKLIRLSTASLGSEGYLNFMGNEFGHPEWVDFPREGNNYSYHYARRQWSLVDRPDLKYRFLANFDRAMLSFIQDTNILSSTDLLNLWVDQEKKALAFRKGGVVFLFNFHPNQSYEGFTLPVPEHGKYRVCFDTDTAEFGGHSRIDPTIIYQTRSTKSGFPTLPIYSPSRTALVLKRIG